MLLEFLVESFCEMNLPLHLLREICSSWAGGVRGKKEEKAAKEEC